MSLFLTRYECCPGCGKSWHSSIPGLWCANPSRLLQIHSNSEAGARKDQSMKSSLNKLCFLVLFGTLLFLAPTWAQAPTGRILGTVTDPKGGVIPGAKITVTNTGTQIHNET